MKEEPKINDLRGKDNYSLVKLYEEVKLDQLEQKGKWRQFVGISPQQRQGKSTNWNLRNHRRTIARILTILNERGIKIGEKDTRQDIQEKIKLVSQ